MFMTGCVVLVMSSCHSFEYKEIDNAIFAHCWLLLLLTFRVRVPNLCF